MRVLVVRNDKLGDLVLALPLVQRLKDAGHLVGVLASSYTAPLLKDDSRVGALIEDGPEALAKIKAQRFDAALVLWATPRNAWMMLQAGIPRRLGTGARLYSLLFTQNLDLRRSQGVLHESEYNGLFAEALGLKPAPLPAPRLHLGAAAEKEALAWLKQHGPKGKGPLFALHPGSGGSAQNWAPQRYAALGKALVQRYGARLLISGGPGDEAAMDVCSRILGPSATLLKPALPLPAFAALLGQLKLFCAASTGPLHVAAAQGVPVLGLYPPLKAMSPVRWAPRGSERAILSPAGLGTRIGRGKGINFTERISVDEAQAAIGFLLRRKQA
jgi:ADP-heptose:LPS heptosyltransferase